ncbi:MAG: sugar nucleotide-binding protein [bacterium]|nr:sugar nucleotide-binding protein [bacterium]
MQKKILIIGSHGFIGSALISEFFDKADVYATYHRQPNQHTTIQQIKCNFLNQQQFSQVLQNIQPQQIIFAAKLFFPEVNITQVLKSAAVALNYINEKNTRFIYLSSDAVFKGTKGNYSEIDTTNPITNYGKFKLSFEQLIQKKLKNFVIVRTSYIYGQSNGQWDKRTDQFITACQNGEAITVYKNMYRSPTFINDLVRSLKLLIDTKFVGIIHVAGQRMSMPDFFSYLASIVGLKNPKLNRQMVSKDLNIAKDTSLDTRCANSMKFL